MAKKKRTKKPAPSALGWAFLFFLLLTAILAALWVLRPLKTTRKPIKPPEKTKKILPVKKETTHPSPQKAPLKKTLPMACIIIDDMGQNPALERKFFELGLVINFSFLPNAPFTRRLATEAHARGYEVLVHLPLQAKKVHDKSGVITLRTSQEALKKQVRKMIAKVPYAIGVNHHMGSLFTEDEKHVRWLLEEVKALGLFYIDSRTTAKTKIPKVAEELALPFAERHVFLDHKRGPQAVCQAVKLLIKKARHSPTIAIGHPHRDTLAGLKMCEKLLREEVRLVPISVFLRSEYDQAVLKRF